MSPAAESTADSASRVTTPFGWLTAWEGLWIALMSQERARLMFYGVALLAGLVGGVGDVFINRWAKSTAGAGSLALGFALCNVALGLFTWLLQRGSLATSVIVYLVSGSLLTFAVSHFLLHEPVSRLRAAGIAVALVGVVMVEAG